MGDKSRAGARLAAAAAGLLAAAGWARAQEVETLKKLDLAQLLDVPITAASTLEERPSEAAASAYVVTEETIRRRGYATLLDLLEDLPQFEVQHHDSETRRNVVTVRGLFGNERVLILYDGVRVTPPSGDFYALSTQFSLRGAKRVEVVVGPMSALYGPDAGGAVINVVTKSGRELSGAEASAGYGMYGSQDFSASAGASLDSLPLGKPFLSGAELSVAAHRLATDGAFLPGRYPGDFAWYNNQYQSGLERTFSGTTAVPVRPFDDGSSSLFVQTRLTTSDFELGYLRMTESHPAATGNKPEFSLYVTDAVFRTNYSTLYGKHSYASDDGHWRLATDLSYSFYEIDPASRFLNVFSNYQDAFKYGYDRTFEYGERLTVLLDEALPLVLGFSYEDHSALAYSSDLSRPYDTRSSPASQNFLYPGSAVTDLNGRFLGIPVDFHVLDYDNVGGYVQLQVKEWTGLQAVLGARYDHNSLYGDSFNPRIGLVATPAERLTFKLGYGEAFLAPSTFRSYGQFGSFAPTTNGLGQVTGLQSFFFHLPNPGLKPEKLREWDADAAYALADNSRASLNAYYSETTNLIADDVSVGPGTFKGWPVASVETSANSGFARTYGATARLDALAEAGSWRLKPDAAYTYSAGESAGNILPYSAKHIVQAGVEASRGKFSAYPSLLVRARSYNRAKDPAGNLQSSGGYALINLYLRWSGLVEKPARVSAYLAVTNLTDRRYGNASFTPGSVGFPATPQEPIRVVGGLQAAF